MIELNYQHLRYFWAVAREGNLTRAAELLHVSQSAVSVQVKKLEQSLGQQLFERRGRGLVLTDLGRVALDYADSIFQIGDELVRHVTEPGEGAPQLLRVGAQPTLSRNFQVGFLGPLMQRGDLKLSVQSAAVADLLERLEGRKLDVVLTNFVPARRSDGEWVAHLLDQQRVGLIGRPALARGRSLEELLREEDLVVPSRESGIRLRFDALTERLGIQVRLFAEVDDMAMLRLVARAHPGLALIPPIVVKDEIASGQLTEVLQLPELEESFYALTLPRRREQRLLFELIAGARAASRRASAS
ncbi:MAG TPA: LysR family transcriptional regulator [Planctomycetes bacterium]|nr:LysR family transcriptional regulator [Planctomycetota bacterium]